MSVFDTIFNDHAIPSMTEVFGASIIDWESGDERVVAVQLATGRSFSDVTFHEFASERQTETGLSNQIKGRLWLPLAANVKQQEQWLIIRADSRQVEVTVSSFGARSGGFVEVLVCQVTVTRFERTGLKG